MKVGKGASNRCKYKLERLLVAIPLEPHCNLGLVRGDNVSFVRLR